MSTLAEILKDKANYSDTHELTMANGEKFNLGQLRELNKAMDGQLAASIDAEKQRLAAKEDELNRGRQELIDTYLNLEKQRTAAPEKTAPTPGTDWRQDPFFQPVAQYLDKEVIAKLGGYEQKLDQITKAIAAGVKYIGDRTIREQFRHVQSSMPEDWRKDLKLEDLQRVAQEQRLFDEGGFPDIEKAAEVWAKPKERERLKADLRKELQEEEKLNAAQGLLGRPGSSLMPPKAAENAPKNMQQAFDQAKQDPDILKLIYGGSA